jgi:hypothetical protein
VLGIHYTGAFDTEHRPLGTICVRMKRNARQVWRFQDNPTGDVDLSAALRWL